MYYSIQRRTLLETGLKRLRRKENRHDEITFYPLPWQNSAPSYLRYLDVYQGDELWSESILEFVELSVNGTIHPGKKMLLPKFGFMY